MFTEKKTLNIIELSKHHNNSDDNDTQIPAVPGTQNVSTLVISFYCSLTDLKLLVLYLETLCY